MYLLPRFVGETKREKQTDRGGESADDGEDDFPVFLDPETGAAEYDGEPVEIPPQAITVTRFRDPDSCTPEISPVYTEPVHQSQTSLYTSLYTDSEPIRTPEVTPVDATCTPVYNTGVQIEPDTGVQPALEPVYTEPETDSEPVYTGIAKTPIWALDVRAWDSVQDGRGRKIRLRLRTPDPLTGCMSRYYAWVAPQYFDQFKATFNVSEMQRYEKIKSAIKRLPRADV